ncbi:MAG: ABC transporter ATP-binding protein [Deltaproteobacteria bacterium]|jgi:branched-chain amino acid transport system ATP-binding protein|nr:ABC transporter ATP-binding protein [Deltaproteobacteria bacterium]MBT6856776.1 ABC transporter ATP-binding protein [Nitrospina sp.]
MLEISNLNTYYGRAHILTDLSLNVQRGEVVALLGRNGAGKSTTLKSINGLVQPESGSIVFENESLNRQSAHVVCRRGIGYVPEERRIFTDLTVMENLEVGTRPPRKEFPVWTPERVFEIFPNLAEMRNRPGGQMSGGEQQMLTIARTLMGNPKLVLLDEPSEGLAPVIVQQMAKTIHDLKREGLTIILSEQNLRFATKLADRAYIIEKGVIQYEGTMDDLAADEDVRNAYLTV